ncbi:MAG TPA: 50S ribosomal protein L13 [Kofleriaceae bacterium]|nr:50S ribosomal protein L13 [Kofleriaceae bacterium]
MLSKEVAEDQREWYVADLKDQVLGRAATRIAMVLRGKHKPTYTPNVDCGDFVIVVNAGSVKLTGNKMDGKLYRHHTEYPGGLISIPAKQLLATYPDRAIRRAVWGMLPKGPLGRRLIKKLKIYSGAEHEHAAQQPRPLAL